MHIKLEGRITEPWTAELSRVWVEVAPRLARKRLVLDVRDVTYADERATQVLRNIYQQSRAEIITGTVWTQSLAERITREDFQPQKEEL